MEKTIEIPEGYEARIEGNKVILERKESEDERIRKEIVEFLTDGIWKESDINKVRQSQRYAKWIAYLERQKEQRPFSQEDFDAAKHEALWGEQKPAEWSEKDSSMLCDIVGYITGAGSSSGITKQERVDFLYGLPKRFNLQPKQGWRKVDEVLIKLAVVAVEDFYDKKNPIRVEIIHFLKSLRPQPKVEWSEEDKRKINRIYEILDHAADDKGFLTSKRIIGDKEAIELQDFLNSLHPSWKPSKEQMLALGGVLDYLEESDNEDADIVRELINDLKNL